MSEQRQGRFARAFVVANRVFGVLVALAGASLLAQALVALLQGRSLSGVWLAGVLGIAFLLVGIVYLRAPLFRSPSRGAEGSS